MTRIVLPLLLSAALASAQEPRKEAKPKYPDDVRVKADVAYLSKDRSEKADLYFPKTMERGKKYPAVVMIHGGGWTGGTRSAARELNVCGNLARAGYIAMSVDYILSANPKPAVWPQNLHDCMTAVRWLRANAAELQVDPDNIGVIGGSAGGHLAALVALLKAEDGLDPKGPYGDVSCRVKCGVDMYGPNDLREYKDLKMLGKTMTEDPELYRKASPVTYARKDSPPMLILHGTADKTVDLKQSQLLADALRKAGAKHELVIVQGAPHTFDLEPKQKDLRPVVIGFFDLHLKGAGR